ncbi:fatty-acid peroxygenase [Lentibacillus halophilus]|uniref:Fatty-acid peroxygenase n=1 Tax=Lentibacillus halophilus TaxID=295065 RepID=A0ABP3IWZ8_9BACI
MSIPHEKGLDHTCNMLLEGYNYIGNRRKRFGSDIFQTRLLGENVICMGGEEAAQIFYDETKFKRKGVAPERVKKTLFGKKGVQGMDGSAHKHRKQLFMSFMTSDRINDLKDITERQWAIAAADWEQRRKVVLFQEAEKIMCRIACTWAGVPLWAKELNQRTNDLSAMIDAFGAIGPRHWRGRAARNRSEQWIRTIINQVRNGEYHPNENTALYAMAWHRDLQGNRLNLKVAAVELLNILRPIVAIGRYVTFGALAMHNVPETQQKLVTEGDDYNQMFVQEVRRYYPFGPFLGARVHNDFMWSGYHFKKGTLTLLDIYGTNHDPDLWDMPDEFRPERFKDWQGSPFDFIPQGGGDYAMGHRCAGEWVTIEIMKVSLEFLAKRMDYYVPKQDLRFSMTRIPSMPKSRFIINGVTSK